MATPFFRILRRWFPKPTAMNIISKFPPFVLGVLRTPSGTGGLVLSSFRLPEALISQRRDTLREMKRCLNFARKIAPKNCPLGLGGWWPIATRRGLALRSYAARQQIQITNGHCGTLASLVLTIKRVAKLADIPPTELSIGVIGVGKMGSNFVRALFGLVNRLVLVDINYQKAKRMKEELDARPREGATDLELLQISDRGTWLSELVHKTDLIICTTSSTRRIVKSELGLGDQKPYVLIDDSRPEAFPRSPGRVNQLIVEGGLVKIPGLYGNYNFGFGLGENVFGCLAETIALSCSPRIKVTLGDVDRENLQAMFTYFRSASITEGDFMSADLRIRDECIAFIVRQRWTSRLLLERRRATQVSAS